MKIEVEKNDDRRVTTKTLTQMNFDERAEKYFSDMDWVQRDIWKLSEKYPSYSKEYCEIFSDQIPTVKYTASDRKVIDMNLKKVRRIMQGPFWLGEDYVVGGFWNERDTVRATLGRIFDTLAGKKCLEIGCMSGYQSFFLNLKKPEYYMAIEPSGFFYQTQFLNSIYRTDIDFRQWFWQDIPSSYNEFFDVVLNCGCLYHESDFVSMIRRTSELLRVGGEAIVATVVLKEESSSGYIKYMPEVYAGDMTYWFAIGEKSLMDLFESFGCQGKLLFNAGAPGDSGNGKTIEGYDTEFYNFYVFKKISSKSRPTITIPRY